MRVAIYARYSSENQSEKSIDDQVRVCKKYIEANGFPFDEKQVYVDEAISGSIHNRPGLQALEKAIENKEIDFVGLKKAEEQKINVLRQFPSHQVPMA